MKAPSTALVWRRLPTTRQQRIAVLIGRLARRRLEEPSEASGRPNHEASMAQLCR